MTKKMNGSKTIVSDIEGDNLLYRLSRFHCGCHLNPFTLEEWFYEEPDGYLATLDVSETVVGHNYGGYDLSALGKLFGYRYAGFCFDTLVLSRLINPERKLHSLESWGYQLGFRKGDYKVDFIAGLKAQGKPYFPGQEWDYYCDAMGKYNVQDVRLNACVFLTMLIRLGWYEWFDTTKEECQRLIKAIKAGDITRKN
jgi:hypothetical protein